VCESIATDPRLMECAERLLSAAQWEGPAMVEFKITSDGTPYLMEINGRLWGSLRSKTYATGRRLRWFLGDFDNLLLELHGKGLAVTPSQTLCAAGRFLASGLDPNAKNEVLRLTDPMPAVHELRT
jgi:hypothetical protein